MSKDKSYLNRIFHQVSASGVTHLPMLSLHRVHKLGKSNCFKIVCSTDPKKYDQEKFAESVLYHFDNKFSLVPGTLSPISDGSRGVISVSMVVTPNTESKEYNAENTNGMKVVSANVFMDESDNIWRLVGDENNKRLVQTESEDLEDILSSRISRKAVHASFINDEVEYKTGDYVTYFDDKNLAVSAGFIFKDTKEPKVFDRKAQKLRSVDEHSILEVIAKESIDPEVRPNTTGHEVLSTLPESNIGSFLEYMRGLYDGTDMFQQWESLLNERAERGTLPSPSTMT